MCLTRKLRSLDHVFNIGNLKVSVWMLDFIYYFTNNVLKIQKLCFFWRLMLECYFDFILVLKVCLTKKLRSLDHVFNTGNLKVNVWMLVGFYTLFYK